MQSITVQAGRQLFDPSAATADECIAKALETMAAFIECGQALAALRDRKLYKKKGYATFEELCRQEFGFSRQHGTRLIRASQHALALPEAERPKTEREARRRIAPPKPKADAPVTIVTDGAPSMVRPEASPVVELTIVGAPSRTIQFTAALWDQVAAVLGDPTTHIPHIVERQVKIIARNRAFGERPPMRSLSKADQAGRKKKPARV